MVCTALWALVTICLVFILLDLSRGFTPPETTPLGFCQSPGGTDNLQTAQDVKLEVLSFTLR